jgi:hypothetical protein
MIAPHPCHHFGAAPQTPYWYSERLGSLLTASSSSPASLIHATPAELAAIAVMRFR